ncbi:translation initiation factor IF-2-like [Onychostruthus taczanowskii]|uniref:translation initiation factor IF-2-like n=1 Tax=Onychostruthus taczanowskii TaxID=356909 RepID=UPI001B80BF69|nr:translation initiation factor IF-2-like [Onychostruthus taczanowskii]
MQMRGVANLNFLRAAWGGDGRVGAGGGACPSNPEAPPPFLPAFHRALPHSGLHLLADVQQLQPIADGAAASPRPPLQIGRGPAPCPAQGHAHRPRPPEQGRDPDAAEERVARGPGHARGRAAAVAPQEPPAAGSQRSSPPNFRPKPPEPPQNGAHRAPKEALEGHAGLRGGGGDPENKKTRERRPQTHLFWGKIGWVWGILGGWGCRSKMAAPCEERSVPQNGGTLVVLPYKMAVAHAQSGRVLQFKMAYALFAVQHGGFMKFAVQYSGGACA